MSARWLLLGAVFGAATLSAADWPQWRGANGDAGVSGFTAPKTWPKELTKKWKVTVGDGVNSFDRPPAARTVPAQAAQGGPR